MIKVLSIKKTRKRLKEAQWPNNLDAVNEWTAMREKGERKEKIKRVASGEVEKKKEGW